ncbi:metal dependent phosphohydrolase with GAF sensor [Candidatus Gastranaerophilus sp. (ex Termes propinquus)]|nr:metal dependent phosphohydrolase with GAF sensor [Candidatus Gastranaerophilus sp. (ex Termes propinquus)]
MPSADTLRENKEYSELRASLVEAFEFVSNSKITEGDSAPLEDLDNIYRRAAALKAFDLVAISLSYIAILRFRLEAKYYRALTALNDAKYLATTCNSPLAVKINLWAFALIELSEKNTQSALDLIQNALATVVDEDCDAKFNTIMLEVKTRAEHISKESVKQESAASVLQEVVNTVSDPLIALLKVARSIALETNIDTLLNIIAQEIKLALSADRCTVFLLDSKKKELWSKVALGMDLKEIRFAANAGLAGYVAMCGETVNIKNVYEDSRFNKEIDQQTGYKTETMLCMPIRNMGHEIVGVFQVLNKKGGVFTEKDEDLLLAIGSSAGIALENAALFDSQQKLIEEQKKQFSSFIDTLSGTIDARDKITSGHSKRVTLFAVLICSELNLSEEEKSIIRQASLLHDIGKLGIKDAVLQKEGKLSGEEYNHIQEHAHLTSDILGKIYSSSSEFREIAQIASAHHEKFDGSGYFKGLKGEEIPLGGRILAVGDVFDAITSKRHYRSQMKIEDAIEVLINDSGKHFDKNIVDVFLSISADKIADVFLCDLDKTITESDKAVLSGFKFGELHTISKKPAASSEEKKFAEIFSKYYENRFE